MPVRILPKELVIKAKSELNEDADRVQEDLDHLRDWLIKQPHINARLNDQINLAFLRASKFSLEKAKLRLDKYYTMKTIIPEFFADRNPEHHHIKDILKCGVFLPCFVTPELTEPRYVIVRVGCFDPRQYSVIDILRANLLLLDIYMIEDDIGIINGLRIFMDFSGHTMAHVPSPIVIKQMLLTLIDVYPNRIKNLTFLNIPTYFEIIFKLIQPFLSDKLKSRVKVVPNAEVPEFLNSLPQDVLPKEYGGNGPHISEIIDKEIETVEKYQQWFEEDNQYKTIESNRPGKPKTAEEMFGVEGSFRKLDVD